MKYWILPTILEWSGIGIAACLLYPLMLIGQAPEPNEGLIIAVAATILGFLGVFNNLSDSMRLRHHKRILQKAGLWTDEYIKKKDLPK